MGELKDLTSEPDEYDVRVTLKPAPPAPPTFHCMICDQDVQPSPWQPWQAGAGPICRMCANHWGRHGRPTGVTRGDYRVLIRLSAIINRLSWQVTNGRRTF